MAGDKPSSKDAMNVRYQVPRYQQAKPNSCWNAAAQMIWTYWQSVSGRQGPMWTHTQAYERADTTGLYPQEFVTLARRVGMKPVPVNGSFSTEKLASLLRTHGPLWCAGYWYGVGHVIVLTGVEPGKVHLNDPDGAVAKTGTLAWFNDKLATAVSGCLMCKDPTRY
ncbi:C39 family peptidase [Ectothiorhodospiraceae bacterium WFHF3C12]|nr:C39 family peptidase [Ectothiorhodospiraceae bacterium WFHF3C12]